jgi:hypothetical protein
MKKRIRLLVFFMMFAGTAKVYSSETEINSSVEVASTTISENISKIEIDEGIASIYELINSIEPNSKIYVGFPQYTEDIFLITSQTSITAKSENIFFNGINSCKESTFYKVDNDTISVATEQYMFCAEAFTLSDFNGEYLLDFYSTDISNDNNSNRIMGALSFVSPDASFKKGEIFSFPNPAKNGKCPVIHVECGLADSVDIKIYNIAAEQIHSATLTGMPDVVNNKYAYEYEWDISDVASGVYIYNINAQKAGEKDIKAIKKMGVIK